MPVAAVILDAHLKSSLAAIRSLGRQGVPVIAASHRRLAMGFYSRYAASRFVYPLPFTDRHGFVDTVVRHAPRGSVILPFSDSTLLPLLEQEGVLTRFCHYPVPACRDQFETAFDKARTMQFAKAVGVEIPATYPCQNEEEIREALANLRFPAVVKPTRSVRWDGNRGMHSTASFAFSPEELRSKIAAELTRSGECPLVQEYVSGEEAGVEFLCDHGRVVAACAHRRIRSSPPAGGPGAVKESIPLSYSGIGDRAFRLAEALQWHGPIMVEFKIDRASGTPKLIEINGRFWGSLPLAVEAGMDFPGLCYRLALGEHLEPRLQYRERVRTRHLQADIKSLLWVLFRKDAMRLYAYPRRLRSIAQFLRPCQPDVADRHDLKPGLMELVDAASRLVSKTTSSLLAH